MGRKGMKRREKNYRASHKVNGRLPPPPKPSSIDALPSKLRQLMAFSGAGKATLNSADRKRGDGDSSSVEKRSHSEDQVQAKTAGNKRKDDGSNLNPPKVDHGDGAADEKKKKKRKRKEVTDLRFEAELGVTTSKRKERKKQRLAAMKKKHKKTSTEENMGFPGREEIKFGEVVEAPPKLVGLPKAFKSKIDASQERLRLQAVEAYRSRKGWTSRLGIQLPSPVTESPLL